MTKEELWQTALTEIQLQISKASFVTWFRNTSISLWKEGSVVISVPNGFSKEWLEKKFNKLIFKTLRDISPHIKDVAVLIEPKQVKLKTKSPQPKIFPYKENADQLSFEQLNIDKETNLSPKYTFNNFIVGSSNELAHAAAFSVSQNLGKEYNPLFIYGGVGLGKTHLLHAIGNELKEKAGRKIQYLSSEKFTNEFIAAVHNQTIKDFREKYRKLDALLIDDIQFIARKERTQEEFFHTFNALHENNKQIVLSSDRHPKSIDSIDERLKSRFEGGMIADIGYPEFETRV
ncbi:MAG: chromosomal replication initiator protein DnaA, partial [Candidatus Spechtbacteria bacterium]|nr:chromosomal replication initiator protein DnaA [Candidatus Spechtbacteria bacterium]